MMQRCIYGYNVGLVLMLRSKGYTIEQLMDKFHCSDTPLKRIFREHKGSWTQVKHKRSKLDDQQLQKLRTMRDNGYTAKVIGEVLGIHEKTVYRYV
jgi:hypothetical protein